MFITEATFGLPVFRHGDPDAEVGKLKAANADVLLPSSYTNDAILFIRTAKNLDYNPRLLIAQNAGWTDPTFLKEMGKDAEGHITRAPFALDMAAKKPMINQVNELFKKAGGRDISDYTYAFTADDTSWTGAEVKSCCRLAALLDVPLTQAAQEVQPAPGASVTIVQGGGGGVTRMMPTAGPNVSSFMIRMP